MRRRRSQPARRCVGCGHTPAQFDAEDGVCGGPGERIGDLCQHRCFTWTTEEADARPDPRRAAANDH